MTIQFTFKRAFLAAAILLQPFAAHADMNSYFTLSENDTVRVSPAKLGSIMTVRAYANFERRADFWNMSLTIPTTAGLSFVDALPGADMTVYYLNSQGVQTSYVASLLVTPSLARVTSSINVPGYWDSNNDGIYETYGSAKWESGYYDNMFVLRINVDQDFTSGQTVVVDGHISSTYDFRDGINYPNNFYFYKEAIFVIGYDIGEVN